MRAEAAIKVALQLVQKWGGQLLRNRPAFAAATPPKLPPSESQPSPPFSLDFARVSTNSCAALHLLLRQLQLRRLRCWKRGFISFRSWVSMLHCAKIEIATIWNRLKLVSKSLSGKDLWHDFNSEFSQKGYKSGNFDQLATLCGMIKISITNREISFR